MVFLFLLLVVDRRRGRSQVAQTWAQQEMKACQGTWRSYMSSAQVEIEELRAANANAMQRLQVWKDLAMERLDAMQSCQSASTDLTASSAWKWSKAFGAVAQSIVGHAGARRLEDNLSVFGQALDILPFGRDS